MAGKRPDGASHVGLIGMAAQLRDLGERRGRAHDQPPCTARAGFGAIGGGVDAVETAKLPRERLADQSVRGAPAADRSIAAGQGGGETVGRFLLAHRHPFDAGGQHRAGVVTVGFRRADKGIRVGNAPADGQQGVGRQRDVENFGAAPVDPVAMRAERGVEQQIAWSDPEAAGLARLFITTAQDQRGVGAGMAMPRDASARVERIGAQRGYFFSPAARTAAFTSIVFPSAKARRSGIVPPARTSGEIS